ncbi:MAG: putative 4-hydroxybenzoate polyprenyltransferase [Bacteroidales bacterium]|nr:putative 4-hydroxybenzoate polyprenyltransferase [Bacteroidales bacterium]
MIRHIKQYASLVVFAHTVFALPFALIAFTMAYLTLPPERPWLLLLQVLGCMVTARNSAMSFNRYADRLIDARNERTKHRELPSGRLSSKAVLVFFTLNVLLFLLCSWSINSLCLYLAFPALAVLCGYSYTKRFSWFCHFVLGLALSMAPAGAYIAVTGALSPPVLWLSLMVLLWVSGFDILYALPDEEHDRSHKLHSIPQRFGRKKALVISGGLHALILPVLYLFGTSLPLAWGYGLAALIFTGLLAYQHSVVSPRDLSKLNRAFFTANGLASLLFAVLTVADLLYC